MSDNEKIDNKSYLDTRRGAFLHTVHMERIVRVYAIIESELKHVTFLNTLAMICASVASFFLALSVSILVNCSIAEQLTEKAEIFLQFVAPLCGALALMFYVFMVIAIMLRKSEWKAIGITSKEVKLPGTSGGGKGKNERKHRPTQNR